MYPYYLGSKDKKVDYIPNISEYIRSMVYRLQKLHQSHRFFLFGARGTDKSTLLKQIFTPQQTL